MFADRFFRFIPKSGLRKALAFFNRGDYRKAFREFEAYLKDDAEGAHDQEMVRMYLVEAYSAHAKSLAEAGKCEEAARALEKAIAIQPAYADIHYNLGMLYWQIGSAEAARHSFEASLAINPNYFRARIMLAKSNLAAGDRDAALAELRRCLEAAPAFFAEDVRSLLRLVGSGSPAAEIEPVFYRLLVERPSSAQVSKQIALESIQNGEYEAAAAELKKALSLNPQYPDLHNLLGIAYANRGMTDDALMEFETALKLHPGYLKARLNLALSLYEKGAREESRRHLGLVLDIDPENELANNLLRELEPAGTERVNAR